MTKQQTVSQQIEFMIDGNSVKAVLEIIAEICNSKAEHIQEAWQDKKLARAWRTVGGRIGMVAARSEV